MKKIFKELVVLVNKSYEKVHFLAFINLVFLLLIAPLHTEMSVVIKVALMLFNVFGMLFIELMLLHYVNFCSGSFQPSLKLLFRMAKKDFFTYVFMRKHQNTIEKVLGGICVAGIFFTICFFSKFHYKVAVCLIGFLVSLVICIMNYSFIFREEKIRLKHLIVVIMALVPYGFSYVLGAYFSLRHSHWEIHGTRTIFLAIVQMYFYIYGNVLFISVYRKLTGQKGQKET